MRKLLLFSMVIALVPVVVSSQSTLAPTVQGVWSIVGETTISTNNATQPGVIIFTAKHYSLVHVASFTPRPELPPDMSKATPADFLAIWGDLAFGANSGTYEVSGATLTTHIVVAKNPQLMDGSQEFTFTFEGNDTLSLRVNRRADQRTFKLRRIE